MQKILEKLLLKEESVVFALLIGSRAKGAENASSDWDIALQWDMHLDWMDIDMSKVLELVRHEKEKFIIEFLIKAFP